MQGAARPEVAWTVLGLRPDSAEQEEQSIWTAERGMASSLGPHPWGLTWTFASQTSKKAGSPLDSSMGFPEHPRETTQLEIQFVMNSTHRTDSA
jgi:hypothetical protein